MKIGTLVSDLVARQGIKAGLGKLFPAARWAGHFIRIKCLLLKGLRNIIFQHSEIANEMPHSCVRCAKCVDACPMFLEPTTLYKNTDRENWDIVERNNVLDCIECGCCSYVCPAKIP